MANDNVDELFGGGEGAPAPRVKTILTLLISGLILAILGLACLSAPGGVLVLLAVMVAEKEMDRIDNGYLPADERPRVQRLRTASYAGLGVVILLFVLQGFLYCSGTYATLGDSLFGGEAPAQFAPVPVPAPPTP